MQAAASSLALASALEPAHGSQPAVGDVVDRCFFDERFVAARPLAARLSGRLTPVRGDVTAVWRQDVARYVGAKPMTMCGVTTESFVFCLEVLARDETMTSLRIERLDRDLHVWRLQTFRRSKSGVAS
jgi:hypothetical protein